MTQYLPEKAGRILPYLLRVRDELRVPVIYVSHDRAEVDQLADRVVVLDEGRVVPEDRAAHTPPARS